MRTLVVASLTCALFYLAPNLTGAAANTPDKTEHPAGVALIDTGKAGWIYQHFPSNMRLYAFDRDLPGKSVCNDGDGCAGVWPALIAPADAAPVGDWTVIRRDDTRGQWAYKGHPVYLRYHDSPEHPGGNGVDGVWHYLEP